MLHLKITTSHNVTHNFCIDRLDFKIDYYIDLVCKVELCPRSAIKKITISEMKGKK